MTNSNEGILYTRWFIGIVTITIVCFDLWVWVRFGEMATISYQLKHLAMNWPIIAVAIGLLIGHVFWTR